MATEKENKIFIQKKIGHDKWKEIPKYLEFKICSRKQWMLSLYQIQRLLIQLFHITELSSVSETSRLHNPELVPNLFSNVSQMA